jgi:hypothetical protein
LAPFFFGFPKCRGRGKERERYKQADQNQKLQDMRRREAKRFIQYKTSHTTTQQARKNTKKKKKKTKSIKPLAKISKTSTKN